MTHKLQFSALGLALMVSTSYGAAHNLALEFIPQGVPFTVTHDAKYISRYKMDRDSVSQEQHERIKASEQALVRRFADSARAVCAYNSHIIALFPPEGATLSVALEMIAVSIDGEQGRVDLKPKYQIRYTAKPLRSSQEEAEYAYVNNRLVDCIEGVRAGLREIIRDNAQSFDVIRDEAVASIKIDLYLKLVHDSPPDYSEVSAAPASGRPQNPPPGYYPPAYE